MNDHDGHDPVFDYEHELALLIEETDWERMTIQLLRYAGSLLRRHGSAMGRYGGKTAEDFVDEAVMLVLEEKRRFPFEKHIPFDLFMRGVLDSLISHAAERATVVAVAIANDRDEPRPGDVKESQMPPSGVDAEEEIIARSKEERFLRSLEPDPDLQEYVRLRLLETCSTAEEYAKALGISVAAVRAMDKRLNRRRRIWNDL